MATKYGRSAEAGAKKFVDWDSRHYKYYTPKGRKATLYEDVTVDVQPDPGRYLLQDWIISFGDGRPAYSPTRTRLQSSDWHLYRAIDEEWERPHYQRQSAIGKMIQMAVSNGRAQNAVQEYDPGWATILQDHVSASKHAEYGLGVALMSAQRDGMTQMINNSLLTNASYKLRYAQDITLYLADIAPDFVQPFDETAGKHHWMVDPIWQPTRKIVETIMAAHDHLEQFFAINVIVEPMILELFRSRFIVQLASVHGDFLTPTVVATAEAAYSRNLANAVALMQLLATDAKYGQTNQTVIAQWVDQYLPLASEAAGSLEPIWSLPRIKLHTFAEARAQAEQKVHKLMSQVGLNTKGGGTK